MIDVSLPAKKQPGDNPKGSLAAFRALKTRVDNQLDKMGDDDPGRSDLQAKSISYAHKIAALIKEHPHLADTGNKRGRSSARSKRFIDDQGKIDRAAIMARYHNGTANMHAHIERLFPKPENEAGKAEKPKPAKAKRAQRTKATKAQAA